jgi:hypothetical protein
VDGWEKGCNDGEYGYTAMSYGAFPKKKETLGDVEGRRSGGGL